MILLKLIEKYGPDGWQDEEGVIHYDKDFDTPFGILGNLWVKKEDEQWVIKKAPGVVLFSKGFIQSLIRGYQDECTELSLSAIGANTVKVKASNGWVRYQLHNDELRFSDQPDTEVGCFLATLTHEEWNAD